MLNTTDENRGFDSGGDEAANTMTLYVFSFSFFLLSFLFSFAFVVILHKRSA